jgi:hypothetical protein
MAKAASNKIPKSRFLMVTKTLQSAPALVSSIHFYGLKATIADDKCNATNPSVLPPQISTKTSGSFRCLHGDTTAT